jgi:putative membrane protein
VISLSALPTVNAVLNSLSAIFLTIGYICIRRKKISFHRFFMISAFVTSVLFLISYITYHLQAKITKFPVEGLPKTIYLSILLTHTVLAAAVPILAIITLTRALRGRYESHRKIARWTYPIWLYVSVTGVIIYVMLYHLYRV